MTGTLSSKMAHGTSWDLQATGRPSCGPVTIPDCQQRPVWTPGDALRFPPELTASDSFWLFVSLLPFDTYSPKIFPVDFQMPSLTPKIGALGQKFSIFFGSHDDPHDDDPHGPFTEKVSSRVWRPSLPATGHEPCRIFWNFTHYWVISWPWDVASLLIGHWEHLR